MSKLKEYFNKLTPEKKRHVLLAVILVIFVVLAVGMYKISRSGGDNTPKKAPETKKELSLEPKLLEKSMYNEAQKEIGKIGDLQKENKDLRDQIDQVKKMMTDNKKTDTLQNQPAGVQLPVPAQKAQSPAASTVKGQVQMPAGQPPLPDSLPPGSFTVPPPPSALNNLPAVQPSKAELYGDIEMVSQRTEAKNPEAEKDKKKDLKILLPPSFMEATLLSGLDAPTVEAAKGHPVPVLLRIKAPAVLPNKVKASLKGCFVIAEGYGNLSDERAHLRLNTLSCLSKKGQAVIDHKIKGFVVDTDGKIGLRGTVVAKMGANLARSLLAGFVAGFGQAVRATNTTTAISPLGATQTIDTDRALRVGVGQGIYEGSRELQKFYLELGKQSMPVIEVGALKNITLVISEGTEMEIREVDSKLPQEDK